jgi:glutamyl-tRNA reductase
LDSLVLGEPQILGQVKEAYEVARKAGTVGAVLHRTLSRALHTAKLVRSRTAIGSGQVSVPSVAAELARRIFGDLRGHSVLLVGSGEMAETVARLLQSSGARLLVIGRTPEKVAALAQAVGGEGRSWSDLVGAIADVDVIIASTSAPGHVIELEHVKQAQKKRRGKSQFYIDLAVPRDVSPAIQGRDGIFLYNIDDLSQVVADSLKSRSREAAQAQEIIDAEVKSFDRWADAEQATPLIVAMRERIRAVLAAELGRSLKGRLRHLGAEERDALATMIDASVNRLLHGPTTRLREAAAPAELDTPSLPELAAAIEHVFALDQELDPDAQLSGPRSADVPSTPAPDELVGIDAAPSEAKLGVR